MSRNYNPRATYRGHLNRRADAERALWYNVFNRGGRFFLRWVIFIFAVYNIPGFVGRRYGYESDDYTGTILVIVCAAMVVNTFRYWFDTNRRRTSVNDPINRKIRAVTAIVLSVLALVQMVRYLEAVTWETIAVAAFLAWDYYAVVSARKASEKKYETRREYADYNYVPHAERIG